MLVCQRWKQVGETKSLWSWLPLRVDTRNLALMPEMLSSRRLQSASFLEVSLQSIRMQSLNGPPFKSFSDEGSIKGSSECSLGASRVEECQSSMHGRAKEIWKKEGISSICKQRYEEFGIWKADVSNSGQILEDPSVKC